MTSPAYPALAQLRKALQERRASQLEQLARGLPKKAYHQGCGRIKAIDEALALIHERIQKTNEASTDDSDSEED